MSLTLVPAGRPVPPDTLIPTAIVPEIPERFDTVVYEEVDAVEIVFCSCDPGVNVYVLAVA